MNGKDVMKVYTYPNAIVRVHFPDLTEEENKRRMKRLYQAAVEVLKEVKS